MNGRRVRKRPMAEINVVPYIDVMLVLLIIFMITAPMLTQGVKVDLPTAQSAPLDNKEDDETLIVSIDSAGLYFIERGQDKPESIEPNAIREYVSKVLNQSPGTQVLVRGDRAINYGVVIELMTVLQGAGAGSVGLVTESP